jgi:hypothetical protein
MQCLTAVFIHSLSIKQETLISEVLIIWIFMFFICQGFKHISSYPGVGLHSCTNYRDFGYIVTIRSNRTLLYPVPLYHYRTAFFKSSLSMVKAISFLPSRIAACITMSTFMPSLAIALKRVLATPGSSGTSNIAMRAHSHHELHRLLLLFFHIYLLSYNGSWIFVKTASYLNINSIFCKSYIPLPGAASPLLPEQPFPASLRKK